MTSFETSSSGKSTAPSPGNRTETALCSFLLLAVLGFLFFFVAGARDDDAPTTVGRVLHWAAGAGIVATIAVTRASLRHWRSGFDWIFAAIWLVLTLLMWLNGML